MTKSEMKALVRYAIDSRSMCRIDFRYHHYYVHCFPLAASDRLFLSAMQDDFLINGFSIRRFRDMTRISFNDDKRNEILCAEGIPDSIEVPDVELEDWRGVFLSLQAMGKNVIVERESLDEAEEEFFIGRIEKVLQSKVLFRGFDADGIWDEQPEAIPFSHITTVTFGSRYVEVFSKYV
jgi:hypothetical protein